LNSLVWSFTPSLLVLSTVNDSTVKSDDDIVAWFCWKFWSLENFFQFMISSVLHSSWGFVYICVIIWLDMYRWCKLFLHMHLIFLHREVSLNWPPIKKLLFFYTLSVTIINKKIIF
jgi:hypothetical protein